MADRLGLVVQTEVLLGTLILSSHRWSVPCWTCSHRGLVFPDYEWLLFLQFDWSRETHVLSGDVLGRG